KAGADQQQPGDELAGAGGIDADLAAGWRGGPCGALLRVGDSGQDGEGQASGVCARLGGISAFADSGTKAADGVQGLVHGAAACLGVAVEADGGGGQCRDGWDEAHDGARKAAVDVPAAELGG